MKYTKNHIINITTKQGEVVDFKVKAPALNSLYKWEANRLKGGYIAHLESGEVICWCTQEKFKELERSNIWRIKDEGVIVENKQIDDLNAEQISYIWENHPNDKWDILQSYLSLSDKGLNHYLQWYKGDKEVQLLIDIAAVSKEPYPFITLGLCFYNLDEVIKEKIKDATGYYTEVQ